MAQNKKVAYEVKVSFLVRVIITENIDPDMDPEFNKATYEALKRKLDVQYVADNIEDYNINEDEPYNFKTD